MEEVSEDEMLLKAGGGAKTEMTMSVLSMGSFGPGDEEENPVTNLGIYERVSILTRPKQSLLTDRSLTIEELQKLHENLNISLYHEPTNENKPYRP